MSEIYGAEKVYIGPGLVFSQHIPGSLLCGSFAEEYSLKTVFDSKEPRIVSEEESVHTMKAGCRII